MLRVIRPEPLQLVILALFRMEDMHKDRSEIHDDPAAFLIPFLALCNQSAFRRLFFQFVAKSLHLRGGTAACDDEPVRNDGLVRNVQRKDVKRLLVVERLAQRENLSPDFGFVQFSTSVLFVRFVDAFRRSACPVPPVPPGRQRAQPLPPA